MFRHWCVTRCWDGGVNGVGVNGAVDVGRMPPWVHSPWPFLWVPWTEVLLLLLVLLPFLGFPLFRVHLSLRKSASVESLF